MVPRITSKGRSFKGAAAYFLHDLGKAESSERVMFTETVNMLTNDPERAAKVMAWTAEHANELKQVAGVVSTGRKAENPVYNYVLAWAPDQTPDREHMTEFGLKSLKALGLEEHEALFIAHNDTDHMHLHIMVNRVHPETGKMANMGHDKNILSRLAQSYEQETGRIYCPERVRNNRLRDLGDKLKADKTPRQTDTKEYQERRAARVQAQKKAAALHAEKLKAQKLAGEKYTAQAAFDKATSKDDLQYRAKEILGPSGNDTQQQAADAWTKEKKKQRTFKSTPKAAKEQARKQWTEAKRTEKFEAYSQKEWQKLSDRQQARTDKFTTKQAAYRQKFDKRLERKYSLSETVTKNKIDALRADLNKGGTKAMIEKIMKVTEKKEAQLAAWESGLRVVALQKEREVKKFETKQAEALGKHETRQAAERGRLAHRLEGTKARQDAKHEAKEQVRAQAKEARASLRAGWKAQQPQQPVKQSAAKEQKAIAKEGQRLAAREAIKEISTARESRAAEASQAPALSQQFGLGLGLSLGRG